MSLVNIVNIGVHDNPTTCTQPFAFEIVFECLQELDDDLEWKVIYVADAEDMAHDQTLEEVLVGPITVGINKFVLEADAPDFTGVQTDNLLGVTVVLVTCSYKDQEFARVGYYVNNEYNDDNYDPALGPPPTPLDLSKVTRHILVGKPRVTRFPIKWSNTATGVTNEDDPASLDVNDDEMNDASDDKEEQAENEQSTEMLPTEEAQKDDGEMDSNNENANDDENDSSENLPDEEENGDMEQEVNDNEEVEDDIIVADGEEMDVEAGVDDEEEEEEDDDEDDDAEVDLGDDETEFAKVRAKKTKELEEDSTKNDISKAPSDTATSESTDNKASNTTKPNAVSPSPADSAPAVAAN